MNVCSHGPRSKRIIRNQVAKSYALAVHLQSQACTDACRVGKVLTYMQLMHAVSPALPHNVLMTSTPTALKHMNSN